MIFIEFRIYDKQNNILIENTENIFISSDKILINNELHDINNFDIMFYIKKRDSNGKKIFENDIIRMNWIASRILTFPEYFEPEIIKKDFLVFYNQELTRFELKEITTTNSYPFDFQYIINLFKKEYGKLEIEELIIDEHIEKGIINQENIPDFNDINPEIFFNPEVVSNIYEYNELKFREFSGLIDEIF